MGDQELRKQIEQLTRRLALADEVIRMMEDDAVPPAAIPAWERYRSLYPRANP